MSKVEKKLEDLEINYLIIDKDIIEKQKYEVNKYTKYLNFNNYDILLNRINKINLILKDNLNNSEITNILNDIEGALCKINY